MIELKNVCKSFENKVVLSNFNYVFEDGSITCIMGASGSGKTTLLNILLGLVRVDSGKVSGVCGKKEQAVAEAKLAKSLGYDAVLLSPGGLNALSEAELLERTEAVAEVMPVIAFYLQTAVGGRVFSYSYWERLCEIKNVVAIKAAPFNRYYSLDVVRAAALSSRADEITLYTGNDDNIVLDLITTYKFTVNGKTFKHEET